NNLKSQLYNEYGNVYQYLGLFEISIKYYNKVIKLNKNILSAKERKGKLIYAYTNKADVFEKLRRSDSAYIYYHKAYKIIPDPLAAANIASCFINYKKNNIDSAGYYLQIASDSLRSYTYSSYQKLI
ncbi:hypothetical protein SB725_30145, partial [Pseudomonas sp. SIMBA_041]|uniref:hypothetical protein n=1 Tax=Pseudomonas sp. SIMBA_041 TaxID=3085782 RepID=UPI00397C325A